MSASETGNIEERIGRLEGRDEELRRALERLAAAPAPVKTGRDWDAYAAVIASFIGLLALAVSGYTAYVERQQLRAQVWPHLQIVYSNRNRHLMAMNRGTGPAKVTAVRVGMGGRPIKSWDEAKTAVGLGPDSLVSSALDAQVLSPGQEFVILQPTDEEESREKFKDLLPAGKHALSLIVCYCSVLGDCWVSTHGDLREYGPDGPGKDACPVAEVDRFTQ